MDTRKLNIRHIITDPQNRDAIHVAVAPVIAAHRLNTGAHVGLTRAGQASSRMEPHIGVVDPYLKAPVHAGEKFWMFLYSQTVTGMRHHWEHPSFPDGPVLPTEEDPKEKAESWLRDFAEVTGADYDHMLHIAATHCVEGSQWGGDYLIEGGRWEGQPTPDEFWTHYETLTGKKPTSRYGLPGIFSCSC